MVETNDLHARIEEQFDQIHHKNVEVIIPRLRAAGCLVVAKAFESEYIRLEDQFRQQMVQLRNSKTMSEADLLTESIGQTMDALFSYTTELERVHNALGLGK